MALLARLVKRTPTSCRIARSRFPWAISPLNFLAIATGCPSAGPVPSLPQHAGELVTQKG